jgi:hypothetical protein
MSMPTDYSENELIDSIYQTTTPLIQTTITVKSSKPKAIMTSLQKISYNSTTRETSSKIQILKDSTKTTNAKTQSTKTNTQVTYSKTNSSSSTKMSSTIPSLLTSGIAKMNQTTNKSTSKLNSTMSTTLKTLNLTNSTKNITAKVTQSENPKNVTTSPTAEISIECPKNYANYCLNSAECFMENFNSNLIEIIDSNHTIVHSKIQLSANCRCKQLYKYYGLIFVSYHGLRCEAQINSFTYVSMSLIVVSLLVLIIFVILLCIFIVYPKRRNPDYPSFSIEYHNKLYRPRKTLSTRNKMSDTDWMQKFRTIRNSWKYINIKMNRSKGRSSGKKKKAAAHFRKNFEETELQSLSNNNNKSLKRFLPKKTTNLLQNSAAGLSTVSLIGQSSSRSEEIDGSSENFLFSNKSHEVQQTSGISLPPTYNSSAPLNTNSLDTKVPSNINVYPKPSRLSNENRFSSNKSEENNEGTLLY